MLNVYKYSSSKANSGRKKRCSKGKSCGASCIQFRKKCLVDMQKSISSQISSVGSYVKRQGYTVRNSDESSGKEKTKEAKGEIKKILQEISSQGDVVKSGGLVKEKDVRWGAALQHGVDFVGGGAFGQFVTVPADRLISKGERKFPGGVGVKAGEIGKSEVEALRKAGQLGVGPDLIAARVSSRLKGNSSFPEGVIAMSKVPGVRLKDLPADSVPGGTSGKAVMIAASALHKAGISHNDMHGGNIYIDSNGKARFVDFGMARVTPKHALAEAMRQFGSLGNIDEVERELSKFRVTPKQFSKMKVSFGGYVSGGGWDKINDAQAIELVKIFYKGVT